MEKYQRSYCKVKVFSYQYGHFFLTNDDSEYGKSNILSCVVNKSIDSPVGSFQLLLFPVREYIAWNGDAPPKLMPGDWVAIVLGNGLEEELVMIGIIVRISRTRSVDQNGMTTTRINVVGQSFGRAFVNTQVWYNPYIGGYAVGGMNLNSLYQGLKFEGDSATVIKSIVKAFFTDQALYTKVEVKMKGKSKELEGIQVTEAQYNFPLFKNYYVPLSNVIDISRVESDPDENILDPNILNTSGSVWQLMTSLSNNVLNLLYLDEFNWETNRGSGIPFNENKVYTLGIVLKKYPFLYDDFMKLDEIKIGVEDIIQEDIGYSDEEVFNYFYLTSTASIIGEEWQKFILSPKAFKNSIRKFGLRRFEGSSRYLFAPKEGGKRDAKSDMKLIEEMNEKVSERYVDIEYKLSGTFVCRGLPKVKIGSRLHISDYNESYFITGINHQWSFPNRMQTVVSVTRGIDKDLGRGSHGWMVRHED